MDQPDPDCPGGQGDKQGFTEYQRHDKPAGKAKRFQRGIFPASFARRHRHGVRHDGHDDHNHQKRHHLNDQQDGVGHGDEAELEGFLGLGQRFSPRISKLRIDALRYQWRLLRMLKPNQEDANLVSVIRRDAFQRFIEIIPLKEELGFIGLAGGPAVNAANHEVPCPRIDGSNQRDLIANLPVVFLGQLAADDAPAPIQQKCFHLFGGNHEFRIKPKIGARVDGELRKEILLVDVDAREPLRHADRLDPFDLTDPASVMQRQRKDERVLVANDES